VREHLELDARVARDEIAGEGDERLGGEHPVDSNRERSLFAPLETADDFVERPDALRDALGGADDRLALRRQARGAARTIEESQAELRLEPLDRLAHRRLN